MMGGMRDPSPETISRFVDLDYRSQMAFAAVVGEAAQSRFIGIARYALDLDARYEYAVSVLDQWQSRGIAAALTKLLFEYARAQGIRELHCQILASNDRMLGFAKWLGMRIRRNPKDAGLMEGCYTLSR
jgi:acetyltransferase